MSDSQIHIWSLLCACYMIPFLYIYIFIYVDDKFDFLQSYYQTCLAVQRETHTSRMIFKYNHKKKTNFVRMREYSSKNFEKRNTKKQARQIQSVKRERERESNSVRWELLMTCAIMVSSRDEL